MKQSTRADDEVSRETILEDGARLGLELTEEAAERIQQFATILRDRAIPLGLVSSSDAGRVYERHLLDSLRAAALVRATDRVVCDLGSGAGLPGVVLACASPWCRVHLVESKRKAGAFLELALDRLGLQNAEVVLSRVEELDVEADLITARAFAPLGRAWAGAHRILRRGGRLVYFAGASLRDPAGSGRLLVDPEPPASVEALTQIESSPPLVIMTK